MELVEINLHDLRRRVPSEVQLEAMEWAREQASVWPYGIYHPNDLTVMYEKGYLRGYLQAAHDGVTEQNLPVPAPDLT